MPLNIAPEFSTGSAISLTLIAAFLWGTWFISIKYLGDYPLDGFYITLFSSSLLIVWSIGLFIDGTALIGNIEQVYQHSPAKILVTIGCGILTFSACA